jgi:hypothetical protein
MIEYEVFALSLGNNLASKRVNSRDLNGEVSVWRNRKHGIWQTRIEIVIYDLKLLLHYSVEPNPELLI